MDLHTLRERTRPEHEATEAAMPLMAEGLDRALYVEVLRRLYPVVAGWERWAGEHAPAAVRPLLAARRRGPWLANDLRVLGAAVPVDGAGVDWTAVLGQVQVPDGPDSLGGSHGQICLETAFYGAFYVMEGSTLGGRFIARQVEERLGLRPGEGDAYFAGHGESTGRMWRETSAVIAAVPDTLTAVVVEAARCTFRAFGEALRQGSRQPA